MFKQIDLYLKYYFLKNQKFTTKKNKNEYI